MTITKNVVSRLTLLVSRRACTRPCTADFSNGGGYYGFMKADWRISIKDYSREKNLKVLLARTTFADGRFPGADEWLATTALRKALRARLERGVASSRRTASSHGHRDTLRFTRKFASQSASPPPLFPPSLGRRRRAQSQRDCVLQPKVARNELPWERPANEHNPNGVAACVDHRCHNPVGVVFLRTITQGGSFLATLGFEPESLWDSWTAGFSLVRN